MTTTTPEDSPLDIWEAARDRWARRECPACEGTGVVEFFDSDDGADGFWTTVDCHNCGGTGYVADSYGDAEACDGCGDEDAVAEAIVVETGFPF